MAEATGKSLKTRNMKWLVSLALLDAALIIGLALPQTQTSDATDTLVGQVLAPGMLPLIVLVLISLFPTATKFALLYWKGANGLPGASAFTRHGPADPRVDMAVIDRQLKGLPKTSSEQNRTWFRLYRQVQTAPAVEQAHQLSLMFRDMAAMSVVLAVAAPAITWWTTSDLHSAGIVLAIFAIQYLVFVASGRAAGARFVCNVLAEHCVAPASSPRQPRASK